MDSHKISKLGIIGLGKMGRCLVQGILRAKSLSQNQILFTTKHTETTEAVEKECSIQACRTNKDLVKQCDTILIAVKPQSMGEVLDEISGSLSKNSSL